MRYHVVYGEDIRTLEFDDVDLAYATAVRLNGFIMDIQDEYRVIADFKGGELIWKRSRRDSECSH